MWWLYRGQMELCVDASRGQMKMCYRDVRKVVEFSLDIEAVIDQTSGFSRTVKYRLIGVPNSIFCSLRTYLFPIEYLMRGNVSHNRVPFDFPPPRMKVETQESLTRFTWDEDSNLHSCDVLIYFRVKGESQV